MTRSKHSYVPFYMNDWASATADMPRMAWSVLFQVCLYNWDKVAPVPPGRLRLMLSDLGKQGNDIIETLLDEGSLKKDARGVYSDRALAEAEKAFDLWQRKSGGGRKRHGALMEESSKTQGADQDQDQDQEPDKEEEGESPQTPRAKPSDVAEAWNEMADRAGLAVIRTMTSERVKRLGARIAEHGADELIRGINLIPENRFLMGGGESGWKANFDWFIRPGMCAKLLEGGYDEGRGRQSAWTND